MNPWLGARRGHLSDWTTQQWVRATGRRVDLGLLPSFEALRSESFDPGAVDPRVVEFYERTADFRLQLWSQWSPLHRPFGRLIDRVFAQRRPGSGGGCPSASCCSPACTRSGGRGLPPGGA